MGKNHFLILIYMVAIGLAGCTGLLGSYASSLLPMDRTVRSHFQPYQDGEGTASFKATFVVLATETPQRNNPYFQKWLKEWMAEYHYCQNGYEIMSNQFTVDQFNYQVDRTLTVYGRCK